VNNELKEMRKEAFAGQFKVLRRNLSGGVEENQLQRLFYSVEMLNIEYEM
jgi:hypothetical protein